MGPITAIGAAAGSLEVAEIAIRLTQILTQTFWTWRNAPDELLALHNSAVFLGVLLRRVKETCLTIQECATASNKPKISLEIQKASEHQLGLAIACLEQLTGLSERLSVGGKAVQRTRWVRLRSTVVEETRRIREVHRDIDSILASYVAGSMPRTHRDVSLVLAGVQNLESPSVSGRRPSFASTSDTAAEAAPKHPPTEADPETSRPRSFPTKPPKTPSPSEPDMAEALARSHVLASAIEPPGAPVSKRSTRLASLSGDSSPAIRVPFPASASSASLFHISAYKSAMGGPTIGLLLRRRVVNRAGSVFYNVSLGNLPLLQERLEREPASVDDAYYVGGGTALELAVNRGL
ncbi:hypothetical protein B0T14DRAFT_565324 [Immersiella caudata]|uniref:Uncharacterized protein n=1 Tax=Immersiella caudata TaxID=314043 RepID=A0AA39WYL2_9PEZI|nr:hypothetical protein B0T14DRAFT_565324 [Immersiella caudata]